MVPLYLQPSIPQQRPDWTRLNVTLTWPPASFPSHSADSLWRWSPWCHCCYIDPASDRAFSNVPLDPTAVLNKLWGETVVGVKSLSAEPTRIHGRCDGAELEATGSRPRYQVSKLTNPLFLTLTFSSSVVTCWNCFDSLTINPPSSSSPCPNHPLHIHSCVSHKWNGRAASAESACESVKCFHCVSPFPSLHGYE